MKVTQFGPGGLPLALAGWSTGVVSVNSNFHTNDGGFSATNFVQGITANGSNMLLRPIANFAAGSNIYLSLDAGPGNSIPSNTIRIHSTGGGGGNIITSNGSNSLAAVVNLVAGSGIALGVSGQDVTITNTGAGVGGAGGDVFYKSPSVTNISGGFNASASHAITVTAPTTGDKLIMVVLSRGRGANSITQTNVTWTQRYTDNANSNWVEVWTGVVSGTGGTTATVAFTGSNNQQDIYFVCNGLPAAPTSVTAYATSTSAGRTVYTCNATSLVVGDFVIAAVCANAPTSSTYMITQPTTQISTTGGQGTAHIFRAISENVEHLRIHSSSVSDNGGLLKIS